MLFVNEIGYVVHSLADRHYGMANKNIGDAFLLVWKFPNHLVNFDIETQAPASVKKVQEAQNITDMALLSFVKVLTTEDRRRNQHSASHPQVPQAPGAAEEIQGRLRCQNRLRNARWLGN